MKHSNVLMCLISIVVELFLPHWLGKAATRIEMLKRYVSLSLSARKLSFRYTITKLKTPKRL